MQKSEILPNTERKQKGMNIVEITGLKYINIVKLQIIFKNMYITNIFVKHNANSISLNACQDLFSARLLANRPLVTLSAHKVHGSCIL